MPAAHRLGGPLFRHDGLIAGNELRATFAAWRDRFLLVFLILAALTVARAQIVDRPWAESAWAALAAGAVAGASATRLIAARLGFHATDGLLAADALHPPTRLRYAAAWHSVGVAMIFTVSLVIRPSLLVAVLPGYIAGGSMVQLRPPLAVAVAAVANRVRSARLIARWLHRPRAGVAAALLLAIAMLPARALDVPVRTAMLGAGALLLAGALTRVDDGVVRFMALAGHRPTRIVARHARGVLAFAGIAAPACWLGAGGTVAAIVVAGALTMLLLMTVRVLAYQLHRRRSADALVTMVIGALVLVGYVAPLLLPLLALAILGRLWHRAARRTWSLP